MKILKLIICITAGYFIGSLNPAALLGKIKKVNLRNKGTGNLGATNTMLVLGKAYGALVMALDIAKAFISVKLCQLLCPTVAFAGIAAGSAAVIGHIFPFYMKFKGGKGLAPYAGMVLAVDPLLFCFLLAACVTLMVIVNYSVALPWSAGILFPLLSIPRTDSIPYILIAVGISALVMAKHFPNLKKAISGEDTKIREFIKNSFKKKV
ncbi:MAG: glycerol-3-phosphate acyltransferase [Ruminococcaceae bacterium]|nr:glycerol-3-phosphate acyltransferase [Oscillospiraceae bacterium]